MQRETTDHFISTEAGWAGAVASSGNHAALSAPTCSMCGGSKTAVAEPLQARGELRGADGSFMPIIVAGYTDARSTTVGEKAAVMLLEDARLAA